MFKGNIKLDSSDEEGGITERLKVNRSYAEAYHKWRGQEELQKYKDRHGGVLNLEESDDSETSTSEEEWTDEHEKSFLIALAALKGKNPKIYDSQSKFFKDDTEPAPSTASTSKASKSKNEKPFLIKDHEREMILEKERKWDGEESDNSADEGVLTEKMPISYNEEQQQIKLELQKAIGDIGSDEDDVGADGDLLRKRLKSQKEIKEEEQDYLQWLRGEVEKLKGDETVPSELKSLKEYWNDPKLDDSEQFLRDYILERKYEEKEIKGDGYVPSYDEIVHDSDDGGISSDERELEQMESFENKFNFRFEEPDQEFIKKYPRTIESSYRRQSTKRKEDREKIKKRKEEERERKITELNQIKAIKRQEILDKILKLNKITGDEELEFNDEDLEGDFDPEAHDRRMKSIFGKYDQVESEDVTKPVFEYDEEIDGDMEDKFCEEWEEGDGNDSNVTEANHQDYSDVPSSSKVSKTEPKNKKSSTIVEELIEASKGKRSGQKKKKSIFSEVISQIKPKFDPKIHSSYQKYFDEYYKLEFEDLIGDLPCRFKYRNVEPNDFGLTTEEILNAEDRELNQWASLKKTFQYRTPEEEKYDVKAYLQKGTNQNAKQKILSSLFKPKEISDSNEDANESEEKPENTTPASEKKKRKKRRKKGSTSGQSLNECTPLIFNEGSTSQKSETSFPNVDKKHTSAITKDDSVVKLPTENELSSSTGSKKKRNRKRKRTHKSHSTSSLETNQKNKGTEAPLPDNRLQAYGINPKKYAKRLKYGKS